MTNFFSYTPPKRIVITFKYQCFSNPALCHSVKPSVISYSFCADLSRPRVGQKGNRVPYRRNQILELEKEFLYNPYPERLRRMDIAKALQLTDRQVKIWFQNRRMKEKRLKNMSAEFLGNEFKGANSAELSSSLSVNTNASATPERPSSTSPLNYSLSNNNHS